MAFVRSVKRLSVAAALSAAGVGCTDPAGLVGNRHSVGTTGTSTTQALECTAAPQGRSYTLFDGTKLEANRVNENIGVNQARLKPYAVLAGEYQRVLGLVPPSLASKGPSFDAPPARWYAEMQQSGVSMNALFDVTFEGCTAFTKTAAQYAAAPTTDTATTVCTSLMRTAWSRSPSPDEIGACTDLALNKLSTESDARLRWAYVCSSVLSASQFLTF
jgi:hypothetical protein